MTRESLLLFKFERDSRYISNTNPFEDSPLYQTADIKRSSSIWDSIRRPPWTERDLFFPRITRTIIALGLNVFPETPDFSVRKIESISNRIWRICLRRIGFHYKRSLVVIVPETWWLENNSTRFDSRLVQIRRTVSATNINRGQSGSSFVAWKRSLPLPRTNERGKKQTKIRPRLFCRRQTRDYTV